MDSKGASDMQYLKLFNFQHVVLLIFLVVITALTSCRGTDKNGSNMIQLKPNEVLIGASWKGEYNLWILTRDTVSNIKYFRESSASSVSEQFDEFIIK